MAGSLEHGAKGMVLDVWDSNQGLLNMGYRTQGVSDNLSANLAIIFDLTNKICVNLRNQRI